MFGRFSFRAALAPLFLAACSAAAWAQTPANSSLYTPLLGAACKFTSVSRDGDDQIKRCPGLAGARTYTHASHTRVHFGVQWPGEKSFTPYATGWSLGDKVEWRGSGSGKSFRPHALIVRVIPPDPDSGKGGAPVLAILRMERGQTCLVAAVDARVNANANELARQIADKKAAVFDCKGQTPAVEGVASEAARGVLQASGRNPH